MHGYAADSPCSSSGRRTSRHFDPGPGANSAGRLSWPLSSPGVLARGALSDRDRQAETRQFLIHAALKRADQLSRLRDLPDTPTHSEEPQPQLAGLPAERSDVDPEESGSTNATPATTIPIDRGPDTFASGYPVDGETAGAIQGPAGYATSRAAAAAHHGVSSPQFFEILFGQQSASISQQAGSQPYPYPVFGSQQVQQYQYPAYSYQQYQQPASSSVQTGYQQYQQPAYASQPTGYQQQQQPAHGYQQTGQQRQQPQSGYANQQAGQPALARRYFIGTDLMDRRLVGVGPRIGIRPRGHAAIVVCTQLLIRAELDAARCPK